MKATTYIEYEGKQIDSAAIVKHVQGIWKEEGNSSNSMKAMNLYVKPEDHTIYYVVNDDFSGCLCLDFNESSL